MTNVDDLLNHIKRKFSLSCNSTLSIVNKHEEKKYLLLGVVGSFYQLQLLQSELLRHLPQGWELQSEVRVK